MRILVTGGAGFIGSHLCEFLLNKGHEVICLDNFFTGNKKNILHLLSNHNFELIRHDIINPLYIEVDQIYNLACPAAPVHYKYNPIKTIKCSTIGMLNMLGLAKRLNARILQASTSEVYGDPEVHPQHEGYHGAVNPLGPRACYDEGKRVAEALCMSYYRHHGVNIRIARIFNTFGPRTQLNDGRVMSNFIIQALKNEPITVYGDGSQTRSFCYISDLVEGLYSLMNSDILGPVNLGNTKEYAVKELAELIIKLTNSKSKIEFHPLTENDPKKRRPDISLAKEKLNWEPKYDVEQGILHTVEYFKNEFGIR